MKHHQNGEVTVVVIVMVAMMAWMMSRGMGLMGMGYGDGHTEKAVKTAPQTKTEPPQSSASDVSPTHQH